MISVADRALYVAKASGRDAWVGFHPGIAALPIERLFNAICQGAQQLVKEGTLRVSSSLTGIRKLSWDVTAPIDPHEPPESEEAPVVRRLGPPTR